MKKRGWEGERVRGEKEEKLRGTLKLLIRTLFCIANDSFEIALNFYQNSYRLRKSGAP